MSNSFNPNPTYYRNRCEPGQLAAFLLGMSPMPPPTQQEIAVAAANRMLENPGSADVHDDEGDENIDPRLRVQPTHQVNQPLGKSHDIVPRW